MYIEILLLLLIEIMELQWTSDIVYLIEAEWRIYASVN